MQLIKYKQFHSRGDTLIEVLCATAVLSLISVGTLIVMNQGSSLAQRSLETTQVREQIDAQAETLRFLNNSYIANHKTGDVAGDYPIGSASYNWVTLRDMAKTSSTINGSYIDLGKGVCPTASVTSGGSNWGGDYFVLNVKKGGLPRIFKFDTSGVSKVRDAETFAQVRYNGADEISNVDGMWIEVIEYGGSLSSYESYLDFNIWACWVVPGQVKPAVIGTKVRLYDPR